MHENDHAVDKAKSAPSRRMTVFYITVALAYAYSLTSVPWVSYDMIMYRAIWRPPIGDNVSLYVPVLLMIWLAMGIIASLVWLAVRRK